MGRIKPESKAAHKINSIASHVPDVVVYGDLSKEIPYAENFHGVLLFADISGFTALTEKFSMSSKKGYGADQLTRTLNSYIGEIVTHILAAGGDILNYAGDAILALWKVERMQLSDVISLAVKCSLNIQDQCGIRETEVGCQLRVKIGISAGKLSKVIMGDKVSEYFVVIGRAVDEVRLAEGLAVASTIILSPNAWELCDRDNIATDPIENERAVKVRYIKQEPNFSVEEYIQSKGKHLSHENIIKGVVRKASRLMPNADLEKNLRKYVMQTVLQKIDDDQPLEYLSEMRPATIVFVNLQFRHYVTESAQCFAIQQATDGIGHQMVKHQGRINKVFMFDKGCTFLCVFGLPGDKREDESSHALQSAFGIHEFCSKEIREVSTASVGVTSGPVFCGVVGHPVRHEYTVIGRKVNLAARLMMNYPGVVSCDRETYCYSKLPSFYFNELPKKAMKGVQNPGIIYQYLAKKHQKTVGKALMSVEREENYPLLGREKEMEVFSNALKHFLQCRKSGSKDYHNVVIYEAAVGYGKSRLLAEIVFKAAKEGLRVISFELAKTDIKQPFYTVQTLMAHLLSVSNCKSYVEREKVLVSKIRQPDQQDYLCFFNDLLLVKFPLSKKVSLLEGKDKAQQMKTFFINVFHMIVEEEPCLCVIDEAHYIDPVSWEFIKEACEKTPVFMSMALRRLPLQNSLSPAANKVIRNPRTLYVKLSGLEASVIAQLACQILGVIRIPREVELFLVERSHGVPYYCEEVLKSLYLSSVIVLEEMDDEEEDDDIDMLFPEPQIVIKKSKVSQIWNPEEGSAKTELLKTRKVKALDKASSDRKFVCHIGEAAKLHEIPIPLALKGMALSQLDHMLPAEQMVVKFAAIIGHTFTTQMLQYILPEVMDQKLNQSLVSLFRSHIFECASGHTETWHPFAKETEHSDMLDCFCPLDDKKDEKEHPSKASDPSDSVWKCKVMRFSTTLVKETAYELWLKDQKKEIHCKCAGYLLKQAHRCNSCGGDEFIFGHKAAIGSTIIEISPDVLNKQQAEDYNFASQQVHQRYQRENSGIFGPSLTNNRVSPMQSSSCESSFLTKLDSKLDDCKVVEESCKHCRCAEIMECVLSPMVRHWMGVGDVPKTFYYLLETAAAASFLSNNLKALSYLNEATIILDLLKAGTAPFETAETKRKIKITNFEKACVYRLKGEVMFNTGQIKEAQEMFLNALKLLNRRLPKNRILVSLKCIIEKIKSFQSKHIETPVEKKLAVLHEQICCLSYISQISCMAKIPKYTVSASLAIVMEVNSAKRSAEEHKIIHSSVDYFHYCQIMGLEGERKRYENLLYAKCAELPHTMEGVVLISYFVRTLCAVKLFSGELSESIEYGFRACKIAKLLNKPGLDMCTISFMYTPLLLTYRFPECVRLLQTLEYLANSNLNSTAKGWFYTACFDILLHTGFVLKSFDECLNFVEEADSDPTLVVDKSLMLDLYSSVALWYARICEWDRVCFFYVKARGLACQAPSSLQSINGHVKFLECHVLVFRKALSEQNKHVMKIYQKTQKLFHDFKARYATSKVYFPRLLHLKAYVYLMSGQPSIAKGLLKKGSELSQKHGNKLEESWIKQSEDSWFGQLRQPTDQWLKTTMKIPDWKEAAEMEMDELSNTRYLLTGIENKASDPGPAHEGSTVFPPLEKTDAKLLFNDI
ncbi:adenylate cyclase type 10 [Lepisosteus oculatus]|uniref:adenylate cyclase type 10 n=1 Tax=Lepisosteus oculatus TaxID=7918 RepID=UPI0035F51F63